MATRKRNGLLMVLAVVAGAGLLWLALGLLARRRAAAAASPNAGSDGPRALQDGELSDTQTPTGSSTATPKPTATDPLPPGLTPTTPTPIFTREVVSANTLSIPRAEHGRSGLATPRVSVINRAGAAVDAYIDIDEFDTVTFGFTPAFTGKILIE